MELVTPDLGLSIWTSVAFIILLIILRAFAWKPILGAVKDREESIEKAISSADEARKEMAALQANNEALLKEARLERDKILAEARDTKDQIVSEAKNVAKEEADRLLTQAREVIDTEKKAALAEIKNQVATLSLDIAGKVIKAELADDKKQQELVGKLMQEVKLN